MKKICIIIATVAVIILGITITVIAYKCIYEYHIKPLQIKSLYNQGLKNIDESDSIAKLLYNSGNKEKAINVLRHASDCGNVISQVSLGKLYEQENDLERAAFWYLKAAKRNNAEAQGELGLCYKYGKGVKQDFSKAVYWLNKGVKNNNAKAQYELGRIYQYGLALYDSYESCFKGPYSNSYDYTHLIYEGDFVFIARRGRKYIAKERFLEDILSDPYDIYIKPNKTKAQYYWKAAAKQGLQEAKDALERVYD